MAVFYDVIVAGGGPAGVAAAIAAARSGAKTLLIEASGSLGGTVTNGSLPAFCPFGNTDEPLIRGIGLELLETLRAETKLPPYYHDRPEKPLYNWFPVDGEALKRILDAANAGGAPVLGVSGPVIKMHGSSTARAVKSAILRGMPYAEENVVDIIKQEMLDVAEYIEEE